MSLHNYRWVSLVFTLTTRASICGGQIDHQCNGFEECYTEVGGNNSIRCKNCGGPGVFLKESMYRLGHCIIGLSTKSSAF